MKKDKKHPLKGNPELETLAKEMKAHLGKTDIWQYLPSLRFIFRNRAPSSDHWIELAFLVSYTAARCQLQRTEKKEK